MIRFRLNATNTVTVTLTENATASNFIYLFQFTNQQTLVDYYFIASDTSSYPDRFNQFSVQDKDSPNTLAGEVDLINHGFYNYNIYQTSLSSTSGLTTANDAIPYITKTLEDGLVWVVPSELEVDTYTPNDITAIAYNP